MPCVHSSVLASDDSEAELLKLKQGYLTMSRNASAAANFPNVAGQVIAGLHFLTVAKILKSIATNKGVPKQVKSRGLLANWKDGETLWGKLSVMGIWDISIFIASSTPTRLGKEKKACLEL